jgi:hypothetical protein
MAKLQLIAGTQADNTPKEIVRKRLRKTRTKTIPQCPSCASRTYIEVKTGTLKQQVCIMCLIGDRIVVME